MCWALLYKIGDCTMVGVKSRTLGWKKRPDCSRSTIRIQRSGGKVDARKAAPIYTSHKSQVTSSSHRCPILGQSALHSLVFRQVTGCQDHAKDFNDLLTIDCYIVFSPDSQRLLGMAFQISIGDVLMLSKLAWDISQAFTSGRKSAPAEFQEVQNQLSSLTHAVESLKSLSRQAPGQDDGGSVSSITPSLQNCRFTLEHLEALVNKYMIIENDSGLDGSERKRWREEIRKNWKKVRWTREGGDLTRLQHNLGVHINSLNHTIAVLNR